MSTKPAGDIRNFSSNGPGLGSPEAGGGRAGAVARATADNLPGSMADARPDRAAEAPTHADPDPGPGPVSAPGAAPAEEAAVPVNGARQLSERRLAANRANAQKSTGPRTEEGKHRSSLNGLKRRSTRLLGLAEARTLRQEPGAAEQLYRELIAPYEPAPALLRAHMEDFARLRLELEAWERIRDARLEARWQQSDVDRRRAFYEMQRDLPGKAEEVLARGLYALGDSPAKFRKAAECLELLKVHLAEGDFDVEPILRLLYGAKLEPASDRAQTICIRCQKLASAKGQPALKAEEFEDLRDLVDQELRDALTAYGLHLDEKTITRTGRLSRLGPTREDRWMNLQGERLRQAIDRKQWVITGLLQTLYQAGSEDENSQDFDRRKPSPHPLKILRQAKPTGRSESTKRSQKRKKRSQTEPNRSQIRGRRR